MSFSILELKKMIKIEQSINDLMDDDSFGGIAYHSNNVQKGDLFFCIKGYKTDGHKYLPMAMEKGAKAAIVEEFSYDIKLPQYKVIDARKALAKASAAYFQNPSEKMKIIGITATNGKTTTSFFTDAILKGNGFETGVIGTVAVMYGEELYPSKLTTPESYELQKYLFDMQNYGVSHVTMEVSSSAMELSRAEHVDFDIVILNNISREHIDLHEGFENYYNAKAGLIRKAKEGSFAVLNLDDSYSARLEWETKAKVVTYSVEKQAGNLSVSNLDLSSGRAKFTVNINENFTGFNKTIKKQSFPIELSVPGYHSVYNGMAAIAVGLIFGIDIEVIQQALYSFKGVERRFEFIFEKDFKIIDDHFANSGNIDVTLGTLEFMDFKELKMVYAIRGGRGPVVNRENAETILKWAPKIGITNIIATYSRSHVDEKDIVTDEEIGVFVETMANSGINIELYEELPDAIALALSRAKEGDLILLAGCQGMDFGAKIALEQIHELRPEIDAKELFMPLASRVAGI